MSDIPANYTLRTVLATDIEPGDIIRGQGGGVVSERPTEERDPFNPSKPYARVHFDDGADKRFLSSQLIDVYRKLEPLPDQRPD